MKSPVYWHPGLYHFIMRQLYGRDFKIRYEAIAKLIPNGANVLEVCMGDAYLYRKYLSGKKLQYLGMDMNETFVNYAVKQNIPVKVCNLLKDEIPKTDYIIMQASLYQFLPNEKMILQKLLDAAGKMLIIAEPVQNLADSKNPLVAFVAKRAANPGTGHAVKRFNQKTLLECFKSFNEFREDLLIDAGKEMIGVFMK